jgi:hypothetical protein
MTREEAIARIKNHKIVHKMNEPRAIYISEALDMAVEALEQESCEDCISREPFTDSTICEGFSCNECSFNRKNEGGCILEERVKALPPVTPKPKTGHWEWVQYDYNSKLGDWHCSECRSVVMECVSKEEKGGIPLYKYCPQCGAKMSEIPTDSEKE